MLAARAARQGACTHGTPEGHPDPVRDRDASSNQRETLRSLGLKRINDVVVKEDRPEIRGMIFTVSHLVKCRGGRVMTIKVHHLRPAPGREDRPRPAWVAVRAPRARPPVAVPRAPRPATSLGGVRGWADAHPHAPAEAQGLQEQVQGRRSRSSTWTGSPSCSRTGGAVGSDRAGRGRRGPQGPAGQGARHGRPRRREARRSRRTRSARRPRRRSRPPAAPPPSCKNVTSVQRFVASAQLSHDWRAPRSRYPGSLVTVGIRHTADRAHLPGRAADCQMSRSPATAHR